MKKRAILFSILLAPMLLTSCFNDPEDFVPKEYGEFNNDYLYRGNFKTKSDGTDFSLLVDEFEFENETYKYSSLVDYVVKDNNIFMLIKADEYQSSGLIDKFLIKYDTSNSEYKVVDLHDDTNHENYLSPESIYLLPDCILAYSRYSNGKTIFVNFNGDVIDTIEGLDDYYCCDNGSFYKYSINGTNLIVNYKTTYLSKTKSFIIQCDPSLNNAVSYVSVDGVCGLQISLGGNYYEDYKNIYFFSFDEEEILGNIAIKQSMKYVGDDVNFVLMYDTENIEYKTSFVKSANRDFYVNCGLYKINYEKGNFGLSKVYSFNDHSDIVVHYIVEDFKQVYFTETKLEYKLFTANAKSSHIYVNYETSEVLSPEDQFLKYGESPKRLEKERKGGYVFNNLIYYVDIQEDIPTSLFSSTTVYTLYRYNSVTNKNEALQCWASRNNNSPGVFKYSKDFWGIKYLFTYGSSTLDMKADFIVLDH